MADARPSPPLTTALLTLGEYNRLVEPRVMRLALAAAAGDDEHLRDPVGYLASSGWSLYREAGYLRARPADIPDTAAPYAAEGVLWSLVLSRLWRPWLGARGWAFVGGNGDDYLTLRAPSGATYEVTSWCFTTALDVALLREGYDVPRELAVADAVVASTQAAH